VKPVAFARENGWLLLLLRLASGALRRVRDSAVAAKLGAKGFRCGGSPRLLGLAHMRVGHSFSAGDNLWLEAVVEYTGEQFSPQLIIGDQVSASDSVHIACTHSVSIGAGTLLGSRVIVSDHTHGIYRGAEQSAPDTMPAVRPLSRTGSVVIGANVWIGDGVAVISGARIGDGCIIGANSVVTGEIPARCIAVGAPARPVRRWDGERGEWVALAAQG
jgi:acetyltransferase-like isoleucine patch superfamily enzyme